MTEQRISVPFTVVPNAPTGEQNAPGCTPVCRDGVVGFGAGFFVVGFGLGLGLTVVGFGAGLGLALVGAGVGDEVAVVGGGLGVVASTAGSAAVVVGATNAGRAVVLSLTAAVVVSGPKVPSAQMPVQNSRKTARTDDNTMISGLLFFFAGSGGR